MQLVDVNVLVYAHRSDTREHAAYARFVTDLAMGEARFGCSELVLSGFVRVVTNPNVFKQPTSTPVALEFCRELLQRPNGFRIRPGPTHWSIFERLCEATSATGKLVADAYHAALAIEHGCEWISADGDFARFPGLRWRHPLAG